MIVEKYTKALISALNKEELEKVYEAISKLAVVAKDPKFILITKSPLISVDEKVKILSEISECKNEKYLNFLKILLINKRIDILKEIHQNLYERVSKLNNKYYGVVEGKVSEETLRKIENKLSEKFEAEIKLHLKESDLHGIKVFVDVLNVELSLNENRVKQDLLNEILKAI